jgi:hypothetical protein
MGRTCNSPPQPHAYRRRALSKQEKTREQRHRWGKVNTEHRVKWRGNHGASLVPHSAYMEYVQKKKKKNFSLFFFFLFNSLLLFVLASASNISRFSVGEGREGQRQSKPGAHAW